MFHKITSTGFGIGYISKGGGTVAAIAVCICWYMLQLNGYQNLPAIIVTAVITLTGVWSSGKVEKFWGTDPQKVVIDEIAGMCISLLFLPVGIKYILLGLILFRFFDIAKPLGIKKMESLPSGWGIMADDALAGLYSNLILQVIFFLKIL